MYAFARRDLAIGSERRAPYLRGCIRPRVSGTVGTGSRPRHKQSGGMTMDVLGVEEGSLRVERTVHTTAEPEEIRQGHGAYVKGWVAWGSEQQPRACRPLSTLKPVGQIPSSGVVASGVSTAGEPRNGTCARSSVGALHPAGGNQRGFDPSHGTGGAHQYVGGLSGLTGYLDNQPALLTLVLVRRHEFSIAGGVAERKRPPGSLSTPAGSSECLRDGLPVLEPATARSVFLLAGWQETRSLSGPMHQSIPPFPARTSATKSETMASSGYCRTCPKSSPAAVMSIS